VVDRSGSSGVFQEDPQCSTPANQGLSVAWPLVAMAAILYGSGVPFDVDASGWRPAAAISRVEFVPASTSLDDIVINILLYIPLGLILVMSGDRRRIHPRLLLAILAGMLVSVLAEVMQTAIVSRCASWMDVGLNVLGVCLGSWIGVEAARRGEGLMDRLRSDVARRPFTTAVTALALGLLAYHVAPFDFVTDTDHLHASFLRARWDLFRPRLPSPENSWGPFINHVKGAVWFVAMGYCAALAAREAGRSITGCLASACKHGLILVLTIECLQLFTASRTFDMAALLLRTLAVAFGAWTAFFLFGKLSRPDRLRLSSRGIPTPLLLIFAAAQVTVLLVESILADGLMPDGLGNARVQWMPFEALWRRQMGQATMQVLSAMAVFGVLAATVGAILQRTRATRPWLATCLIVVLVALAIEVLHMASISRVVDLTQPVLALAAALGVRSVVTILSGAPKSTAGLLATRG